MNLDIGTLKQTGTTSKTQGRLMGAALVDNKGKAQTTVLKVLERVAKTANEAIARM